MSPFCCRPHVAPDPHIGRSDPHTGRSDPHTGRSDPHTGRSDQPFVPPSRPYAGGMPLEDQHRSRNGTVDHCGTRIRTERHSPVDRLSSIRNSFVQGNALELKINDLLGNGISGILYKWVSYGKGWRPRWFVLHDGVLSYYKIHGPDRIDFNKESEKGTIVIGEESIRWMSQRSHGNGAAQFSRGQPIGQVHLKVSTIRESRSDEKRFSIFSGTEILHLRTETEENRRMWMEALNFVKGMFPRMLNSELMGPVDNVVLSTVMLRQRLQEEGIGDIAIRDIEQIMRSEFSNLQKQVVALKQKHSLLLNTLRQLE